MSVPAALMTPQRAWSQWQTSGIQPMPQSPYNMPGMPLSRYNPYLSTPTFPLYHAPDNVDAFFGGTSAQSAQTTASASETAQAAAQAQAQQRPALKGLPTSFAEYYIPRHLQKTWINQGTESFKYDGPCLIKIKAPSGLPGVEVGNIVDANMQVCTGKKAIMTAVKEGKTAGKISYKPSIKMPKFGNPNALEGVGEKIVGEAAKETKTAATSSTAKTTATAATGEAAKTAAKEASKQAQKVAENLAKRTALMGSSNAAMAPTSAYQVGKAALKSSGKTVWFIAAGVAAVETAIDGYSEYKQKGRVGMGTVKAGVENFCSAGLGTAAAIVGTALGTPAVGFIAGMVGGFVGKYIGKGINWCIGKFSPDYAKA